VTKPPTLPDRCERLRSLHVPGEPLLLPNAWDVASARAVVAAGFPVVATTSAGVAAALGYEDHQGAPAGEMLAAAERMVRGVDVPVTVDAEAGYGMEAAELVAALRRIGAAGCNLEDTDHDWGVLREPEAQARRLRAVRRAARDSDYPLVVNARIDTFLAPVIAGSERPQAELLDEALERAGAYLAAGADVVYPIAMREPGVVRAFVSRSPGPVNVLALPGALSVAELAKAGVARISWGALLHRATMEALSGQLASLAETNLRRDG
jgi:2-methylisocitrate lyase-like PEP mutase family enzyme